MLVSAHEVSQRYNEIYLLDHVDFAIEEKAKIALVGNNGAGKSTLLKVIAGLETYEGTIMKKKDLRIAYLPQDPSFHEDATLFDEVKALSGNADYEIKAMLNRLGLPNPQALMKTLSGGQRKRAALAIALLKPCDLLLLDEPTNHLDHLMIEWLQTYLQRLNAGLLMVTHDRYFLDMVTQTIWEIDAGKLTVFSGNYSFYLEQKAQLVEIEQRRQQKTAAFLRSELEWVRAGVQARGTKDKGRLDRYYALKDSQKKSRERQLEKISFASRLGKKTIELKKVSFGYEKPIFSNFSYLFKRDERVGIIGANGSGKSTLLNVIAKELTPQEGEVVYGDTVKLAYYRQHHETMDENLRVIDYLREETHYATMQEGQFTCEQLLERFLLDEVKYSPIQKLSGGEKRRLYLLRLLLSKPNVLLLDEITNDFDLATLSILEDMLDGFEGILIMVSHDRYLLDRLCDTLFVFEDHHIDIHTGSYSNYYVEKEEKKNHVSQRASYEEHKKQKKQSPSYMSSKEKKELANMEHVLSELEARIADIDCQMETMVDYPSLQKLSQERSKIEAEIETKSDRWLYLMEKEEASKHQ